MARVAKTKPDVTAANGIQSCASKHLNGIVADVERRLSVIDNLETVITANLARATRLRQAILQEAFTG